MVEPVQVCDGKLVDAVDHGCITRGHGIKPAAAAGPAGCRSKFAAQFVKRGG